MKLAFLFLIRDTINFPDLWTYYFQSADPSQYSIYIHYKDNIDIGWFNQFKVPVTIETHWGNISLVKAMNILLEQALMDHENQMFIFLSESCVPIKSIMYILSYLNTSKSYFTHTLMSKNDYYRTKSVLKYINPRNIKKAAQWCIINRKHATYLIQQKNNMINIFKDIFAADEHCYITFIYNNFINEIEYKMTTCAI